MGLCLSGLTCLIGLLLYWVCFFVGLLPRFEGWMSWLFLSPRMKGLFLTGECVGEGDWARLTFSFSESKS